MSLISLNELRTLVEQPQGICVSIYLPTIRASADIAQNPIRFKNLIRQAEAQLQEHQLDSTAVRQFLQPAMDLDKHEFWQHQEEGLAVLISQDFLRYYRSPIAFEELVVVGDRFHLKPLLPLLTDDSQFYILALSQHSVKLLEATRYGVKEVEVPDMPSSLEDTLLYDPTSKTGQFRIQTGKGGTNNPYPSGGSFHGQGAPDRDENQKTKLQYFHIVDRAVYDFLKNEKAPLILVGVEYLIPLYRDANNYPHLVDEFVNGNFELSTPEEIHAEVLPIMEPRFTEAKQQAIARYQELSNTDKVSTDLNETVSAAYFGRVDQLLVAVGVQKWGNFNSENNETHIHEEAEPGDEDLLNSAAIQTLLNGGTVYAMPPEQLPEPAPLAAVFRY